MQKNIIVTHYIYGRLTPVLAYVPLPIDYKSINDCITQLTRNYIIHVQKEKKKLVVKGINWEISKKIAPRQEGERGVKGLAVAPSSQVQPCVYYRQPIFFCIFFYWPSNTRYDEIPDFGNFDIYCIQCNRLCHQDRVSCRQKQEVIIPVRR